MERKKRLVSPGELEVPGLYLGKVELGQQRLPHVRWGRP